MKIVFPTDFSDAALHAFSYVRELAEELNAVVSLVHVYDMPVLQGDSDFLNLEELLEERRQKAEMNLKALAGLLPFHRVGEMRAVFGMFVPDEIVAFAEQVRADMIAMGAKGEHSLIEKILGSVTTHTMLKSPVPVLSIPHEAEYRGVRRIAYATDLHPHSWVPLGFLKQIAQKLNAEIRVVHVRTPDYPSDEAMLEVPASGDEAVQMDIIEHEDVECALNDYIQREQIDWLGMFIPRRRLWERLFHRSLSKRMFFHSSVPLLTFRG